MRLLQFVVVVVTVLATTPSLAARKWADSTGEFSIEADFVRLEQDAVVLKRTADGAEIKVPRDKLSAADRDFLRVYEIDPVELLKLARAAHEKLPAEVKDGSELTPLAVIEYLYGDRETGLKYFAKSLKTATASSDMYTRFGRFGEVLQAQRLAGLVDAARETIRIAEENAKTISDDAWDGTTIALLYSKYVIHFLLENGSDEEAIGYVANLRPVVGATNELTIDLTQGRMALELL